MQESPPSIGFSVADAGEELLGDGNAVFGAQDD
jgi:hypothetical protein